MKYCPKCGEQMQDNTRFCINCENAFLQTKDREMRHNVEVSYKKPGTGMKFKIIIGALLVVILVTGSIWGWKSYGSEAQVESKLDLAVKYLSENKYEEAVLAFNEVIEIDPKEVKGYQGLARTYTLQEKYDDAQVAYEKGINTVSSNNKQILQLGLAGMYIDQNKLSEAEKAFEALKNTNQNCLEAYWGLAMVYQQNGDNSKAEAMLKQAIEQNPNEYRAYNTLALFLKQNNQTDEAFNNLVKSLSLEINQQGAYLVLNEIYQGRWTELLAGASGITNQLVASMLEFYSYYVSEDYVKALNIYQEKLASESNNQKSRILTAIAMVKTGDKASAELLIKQLNENTLKEWLLGDLAQYYQLAGDQVKAREHAIKALEANGTNLEAVALLQNLSTDDPTGKIYAAQALLYNWKPVIMVKEEMQAKEIILSILNDITPTKEESDASVENKEQTQPFEKDKAPKGDLNPEKQDSNKTGAEKAVEYSPIVLQLSITTDGKGLLSPTNKLTVHLGQQIIIKCAGNCTYAKLMYDYPEEFLFTSKTAGNYVGPTAFEEIILTTTKTGSMNSIKLLPKSDWERAVPLSIQVVR
ncbi:MAG: tetratricopeptide repeat protein [Syntrophomonadaceae bacterium]|nr:tetratricopeptide repeat protein [Syntrophomonadaceae bacterium]